MRINTKKHLCCVSGGGGFGHVFPVVLVRKLCCEGTPGGDVRGCCPATSDLETCSLLVLFWK